MDSEGGNNVWQRQQDVLKRITEAENLIREGEKLQSPFFDQVYGSRKYYLSVSSMWLGCDDELEAIFPQFSEKYEKDGKTIKLDGKDTQKYQDYTQALLMVKEEMNKANSLGNSAIAMSFYQRAYQMLRIVKTHLREDIAKMGFDFRKKQDPSESFRDEDT